MKNKYQLLTDSFVKLSSLFVVVGFVTRIILTCKTMSYDNFTLKEWFEILSLGVINDLCVASIGFIIMWFCILFLSENKYKKPWGYSIFFLLTVCLIYLSTFNTIFDEYGSAVPKIVKSLVLYKFISFGLRLFIPSIRKIWSLVCYKLIFFLYVTSILFIAIGEYFFWDEFGVRYNFIAVDYLVYTNEVIGNVLESYPIVPILIVLFSISATITYLLTRKLNKSLMSFFSLTSVKRIGLSCGYFSLVTLAFGLLFFNIRFQTNEHIAINELQANGSYRFCLAFYNSELSYNDFYATIPQKEAIRLINNLYTSEGKDNVQHIRSKEPEIHKNIVLITVESLSASFLKHYGNTESITPNLDSIMDESLVFNNLYATGNRTVRGLEAVTLCLPPSPGESIIKQANNSNLFSTGKVLKNKGYTVQYLYGGDSYFDNMETFFGGNGYDVIDKKDFSKDEITFSNIWGVCDEDMFNKAIEIFNQDSKTNKPFFGHIMTVSNHRPFTYPDNKIDIPSDIKSRNGGVKYTDYAIGKFFADARKQDWFGNTVFIIVADHCASSAGKIELPIENYHIPAMIYSPGFIHPQEINTLSSQIDLMPTVFGLLDFSYDSQFYGKNILADNYHPRSFVSTYQNLGYMDNNIFTILSPVRKIQQYPIKEEAKNWHQEAISILDSIQIKTAISNYQIANNKVVKSS